MSVCGLSPGSRTGEEDHPSRTGTCICWIRWPRLHVVIGGSRHEVEPAVADRPVSTLSRTWCAACGDRILSPFRGVVVQNCAVGRVGFAGCVSHPSPVVVALTAWEDRPCSPDLFALPAARRWPTGSERRDCRARWRVRSRPRLSAGQRARRGGRAIRLAGRAVRRCDARALRSTEGQGRLALLGSGCRWHKYPAGARGGRGSGRARAGHGHRPVVDEGRRRVRGAPARRRR